MKRNRRVWKRPEPSPLDRALNVGVSLPSFNFIEPKAPRNPTTQLPSIVSPPRDHRVKSAASTTPDSSNRVDVDAIIYHTLARYAQDLAEPTLSEESKITRLWQSLLRHSEAGRFGDRTAYSPNPICSFMAMDILRQVLEQCGVSLMVMNMLLGAVGNSIFARYEPEKPCTELAQYADVATDLQHQLDTVNEELAKRKQQAATHKSRLEAFQQEDSADRSTEETVELITTVVQSVDEPALVPTVITEAITPFLNEELLLLLWNATAKSTAERRFAASPHDPDTTVRVTIAESRTRAFTLATRVLQERVRLLMSQWQTLSHEERAVVANAMTPLSTKSDGTALRGVLQTLEEMYTSEQTVRDNSSRRSMFLSPMARHASVVFRQSLVEVPTPPSGPRDLAKPRRRMQSTYIALPPATADPIAAEPPPPNASIPEVLLGALAEGQQVAGTDEAQLILEKLSADQDEILRQCEEVFDLLCVDSTDAASIKRSVGTEIENDEASNGESDASVQLAKKRLCELLCAFVDAPSFIMEKFEQSEARRAIRLATERELDDGQGTNTFVQAIIQRQKQNPMVLVNAINQSPEILLSAVAQNNGILRFVITKFAPLVKRFLRLDLKAGEHIDMLAHKNKGVQLLWGNTPTTGTQLRGSGTTSSSSAGPVSAVTVNALGDMFEGYTGQSSSTRGATVSPSEQRLLEWFGAHTTDLAALTLKRPETLKPLFVELHSQDDAGAFYKVMLQLVTTTGVQNYLQRVSITVLEKIAQEDPAEVTRLLREIVREPANRDILEELQQSPYLTTCLCEFHPTVIQDVISSDLETWHHFFVDTVTTNDAMLKECLVTRTEQLEGSEVLAKLFSAVVSNATAGLNLAALDFRASPADFAVAKEREVASRRKMGQCLYLRGGSSVFRMLIAQLIAGVGFHPHELRSYVSASLPHYPLLAAGAKAHVTTSAPTQTPGKPRAKKAQDSSSASSPSKKRTAPPRLASKENPLAEGSSLSIAIPSQSSSTAIACAMESMPLMWQSFVQTFRRHHHQHTTNRVPTLTRAHTKTLILDIWIEFVKVDTLQLDNGCVWGLAPFVCDFFLTRYNSAVVVGEWLYALTEAVATLHDDPRISFFACCCGLRVTPEPRVTGDGYDTFLYYAHALALLLFGEMKTFRADRRLEEAADGSCFVDKVSVMATAARLFDHRTLSGGEIATLMTRLDALPLHPGRGGAGNTDCVELDDVMAVFLDQWRRVNTHVDERYAQAFAFYDTARSNRIGLDQFTKIVTGVTQQRLSTRECLLVYCDVGLEFMDLDTLLRVTRVYHVRLFNVHLPELILDEGDLHELKLSVGRTNIFSVAREMEDLDRFWKGLHVDVQEQVSASHQTKTTKMHLKKQTALIDKLLHDIHAVLGHGSTVAAAASPSTPASPNGGGRALPTQRVVVTADAPQLLQKAWTELRACAKMIHSAKLTQHYLSRLYLQTCLVRWIRQARKRTRRAIESDTPLDHHDE